MKLFILASLLLIPFFPHAQIDTSFIMKIKSLDTANILKLDTLPVPNDLFTKKIKELRSERKGLNIETIIRLKIKEEQEKDTSHSKEYYGKLLAEVTTGKTGQLIENSVINLYRRSFSITEVDDLIRFYKTPAGKKMDTEFILLLVESVKDTEQLMKMAVKNMQ